MCVCVCSVAANHDAQRDHEQPHEAKRMLLNNVSGVVKPGELFAIMGASGAGKSYGAASPDSRLVCRC